MMDWSIALDACLVPLTRLRMTTVSYNMTMIVRWRDYMNMDQHALTIPVGCSQPLNLLPSHLIPVDSLIPLLSHLCQLYLQPLHLTIMVML